MRVARVEGFEAPFVLADADRAAYRRRFVTLFVLEGEGHSGGTGRVEHARNAQGEHVALKLLADPQRHGAESDEEHARRVRAARAAFEREYECHAKLSGLKGFPRLFGRGQVAGVPCIVMEWVEGVTLDRVRRTLVVDGAGRVSPLVAARIGRDLFDLVARMGFVEGGFVHRDISPRNVMVRTSRLTLAQQVEEGVFDLYLIDFGSSADVDVATSFTRENAVFRGATADYAPPEMLSDDIPGLDELRKSSAIDVYAAASVVYRLASGHVPYELHGLSDDGRALSPYRAKMAAAAPPAVMAHEDADALVDVLAREPEAAVAVQQAQDKLPAPASVAEAADALTFVDRMFAEVLADCLVREQADRPAAAAVREALSSFSVHYAENVERSLSGKPLVPCACRGGHFRRRVGERRGSLVFAGRRFLGRCGAGRGGCGGVGGACACRLGASGRRVAHARRVFARHGRCCGCGRSGVQAAGLPAVPAGAESRWLGGGAGGRHGGGMVRLGGRLCVECCIAAGQTAVCASGWRPGA